MHELAITSQLLESVEREAERVGARRVLRINLVIGERTGVVDDSLRFCFEMLAPGTVAEGAAVEVRRTPMRFGCDEDGPYSRSGDDFRCPRCGRVGAITDGGAELLVESMEVET